MSNSGGSWGPDRRLWLTGQGIAWDLSGQQPTLWTIKRSTKQVLQFSVPYRDISEPAPNDWHINGPGHFE
jgi:hypothetical protein